MAKLTRSDLNSDTWKRVVEHVDARRAELRGQLEQDVDHDVSTKLRGRLAELNQLLALAKPAPAPAARPGFDPGEHDE